MADKENLIKEVEEILTDGSPSTSQVKKLLYDSNAKQFFVKIPKKIVLASRIKNGDEVNIVFNPTFEQIKEATKSSFIIYGKEKESTS